MEDTTVPMSALSPCGADSSAEIFSDSLTHTPDLEDIEDLIPQLGSSGPISSTPYPNKFFASLKPGEDPFNTPSNTDSSDRSVATPSTAGNSNSSMEIFLGPQPVPFIRNRQRLPSGDSEAPAPTPPSPPTMAFPKVSKWRQEQMKKAKSARPVPGSRERPIPLLHGPLSLPYARNPSGVDATVADANGYLSNVYGLRMAPSPGKGRIISDSTTGRTVSSSSYQSSSFGTRPTVVRDYNQVIGIKKDENPFESKSAGLRNLGLGKPNPAMHDDAIHSASGPWRSVSNTGDRLAAEFNLLTFVDPATNQIYAVRVPKSNMATATNTNVNVNMATDRVLSAEYVSKYGSSKADASANWRSKVELSPPGAPPVPANSPMGHFNIATDPGVLTVEHLYEKFGKDVIDAKPSQSLKSTTAAHETPKTKTTFGSDTTNHKANIQPASPDKDKEKRKPRKSRRDGRQRGTPGAGKHLKRTPTDDESADKATAAADLPPASPRKTRGSRAKALSPTPNRVKSAKA